MGVPGKKNTPREITISERARQFLSTRYVGFHFTARDLADALGFTSKSDFGGVTGFISKHSQRGTYIKVFGKRHQPGYNGKVFVYELLDTSFEGGRATGNFSGGTIGRKIEDRSVHEKVVELLPRPPLMRGKSLHSEIVKLSEDVLNIASRLEALKNMSVAPVVVQKLKEIPTYQLLREIERRTKVADSYTKNATIVVEPQSKDEISKVLSVSELAKCSNEMGE